MERATTNCNLFQFVVEQTIVCRLSFEDDNFVIEALQNEEKKIHLVLVYSSL